MKLITVKAVSNPVVQMIAAAGLAAVMYMAIRDVLERGPVHRRVHVLPDGAAPGHRAAAAPRQRRRPSAAGHRGGGKRFRGARCRRRRTAAAKSRSARPGRHRVPRCDIHLRRRERPGAHGHPRPGRAGRDRRDRRPLGQRQIDARQPVAALPRPGQRRRAARRRRHPRSYRLRTCATSSRSSART